MNRPLAHVVCFVCLITACKKAAMEKEKPNPTPAVADAAAATVPTAQPDAPVVIDAGMATVPDAPAGALVARVDGVGPINAKTRVDVNALKKLFPDYEVKKTSIPMGDGELREDYVAIRKGKTLVLKIVGDDDLLNVDIMSNDVWNQWGVQIGMTHTDVEKLLGKLECSDAGEATDWREDIAECGNEKTENYILDFTSAEAASAKELLTKPADLAKAKLVAIRWEVPGKGPPVPGTP